MRTTGNTFRRLRLAMLGLGAGVGLGFPSVAYYALGVTTAETIWFHTMCIAAGLLVGAANYALFHAVVDRHMSRIARRMRDYADAYAAGELMAPPVVTDHEQDALAKMQRAFATLAGVVTDQLENERVARRLIDALSETVELRQTCAALLQQLREMSGASMGIVYVRTSAGWERCASFGVDTSDAPAVLEVDSRLALAAMEGPQVHDVDGEGLRWMRVPTLLGAIVPTRVHTFPLWFDGEPVGLVTYGCPGDPPEHLDARLTLLEREAGVHIANARLHHQLSELAAVDDLTKLLNRCFGQRRLNEAYSLSSRSGTTLGVAMFDIDYFKKFNDTHGHAAGDAVLSAVAGALSGGVREYDAVVRWGGEEMLLIAPDTPAESMAILAERLRAAVENVRVQWQGHTLHVTVSVGVATCQGAQVTSDALVALADAALYRAKHEGRNRVVCHGEPEPALSLVNTASAT